MNDDTNSYDPFCPLINPLMLSLSLPPSLSPPSPSLSLPPSLSPSPSLPLSLSLSLPLSLSQSKGDINHCISLLRENNWHSAASSVHSPGSIPPERSVINSQNIYMSRPHPQQSSIQNPRQQSSTYIYMYMYMYH